MKSLRPSAFKNMQISTKLGLVVLVLTVPIVALLFFQFQDRQAEISFAESESDGLDYVTVVMPLLSQVQLHRGLAQKVISGENSSRAALDQSTEAIDKKITELNAIDARVASGWGTAKYLAVVRDQWENARNIGPQTTEQSSAAHTDMVVLGILPLLHQVGVESKLYVDPDVAARGLLTALVEYLPRMTEGYAEARSYGARLLIQRDGLPPTDAEKQSIISQAVVASAAAESMLRHLDTAAAHDQRTKEAFTLLIQKAEIARFNFAGQVTTTIVEANKLSKGQADSFFYFGGSAIDASNALLTKAQTELQAKFDSRVGAARNQMYIAGGAAFGGLVLAIVLVIALARSVTRPIGRLVTVADRMSLGELDVEIDVYGSAEVGQLAESLRRMQASLRSAIERLRMRRAA